MEVEINHSFPSKKIKTNNDVSVNNIVQTSDSGISFESHSTDIPSNSNSDDLSYHDDGNCEYMSIPDDDDGGENCEDDVSIPEDDDNSDYAESIDYDYNVLDEYSALQAQFDNVDLPPGVEASVSWLDPTAPPVGTKKSSTVFTGFGTDRPEEETVDEAMVKYVFSKRFDTVEDIAAHDFTKNHCPGLQPSNSWVKKIQQEWEILSNNLPDTIFVRVYESRMDLLTAVIVGPQGTPYHDGLFVFDAHFPPSYPDVPPLVHYYAGGLRLNPNLYECGKVCLSLLGTWSGNKNEKWIPQTSTMLQVLLSIQALILNAKPYFNEPGYEDSAGTVEGEKRSYVYTKSAFIFSLRTMIFTLNKPPKCLEDVVVGHFRLHARDILKACKAYISGAKVGSLVNGKIPEGAVLQPSKDFADEISKLMPCLITNFIKHGVKGLEEFSTSE